MKSIIDAEALGYRFQVENDKLRYAYEGRGDAPKEAESLLRLIISSKQQVISFLISRKEQEYKEGCVAIKKAYCGELMQPTLIKPSCKIRDVLGESMWLCPDAESMSRAQKAFPDVLCVTANELFCIMSLYSEKGVAAAVRLVKAKKLFGGEIGIGDVSADVVDSGAGIDPGGSALWLEVLQAARLINKDFFARLLYIRGTGARLEHDQHFGYCIAPIIDETGEKGWTSLQHYDSEKWVLKPFAHELADILKKIAGRAVA